MVSQCRVGATAKNLVYGRVRSRGYIPRELTRRYLLFGDLRSIIDRANNRYARYKDSAAVGHQIQMKLKKIWPEAAALG